MSLTQIADEEGTDKGTVGPVDTWDGHNYTDVYGAYLQRLRDAPITILEVGLGVTGEAWKASITQGRNAEGGGSMRMWYRYLPNARIFGIDINPADHLDRDRITTAVVDQGDPDQLRAFVHDIAKVENFDVIIDDGSHRADHQQITLSVLFPYVAAGGLYFVEDLLDNGKGDAPSAFSYVDTVLSTRRVLREFAQTGAFPQPNAFVDERALIKDIDAVTFHCPRLSGEPPVAVTLGGRIRAGVSALRRGPQASEVRRFVPGQEQLCAIRKAG